jgi:hypothetical protein
VDAVSTTLSIHPETERLRREYAALRHEFARAVMEARDLDTVTRPYLLALFQTTVGAAELARLVADLRYRRARRALELIQAAMNRGRAPDLAAIQTELELELAAHDAKVAAAADAIERARRALSAELMDPADAAELRRLYTKLVMALHPDLHPDQSSDDVARWHRLQRAYDEGDLDMLRALAAFAALPAHDVDSLAALQQKIEKIRDQLRTITAATAALLETTPFCLRAQLEDDAWVTERRAALEAEAAALEARAEALEVQAQLLTLGGASGGPGPN